MSIRAARVLVVDDEPSVCELIRLQLSERGLECQTVTMAQHARQLLGTGHFDLLIADLAMTPISGLDLLAFVKEQSLSCKVILITGASRADRIAQALEWGAFDYIEKPYRGVDLAEAACKALSGQSARPVLPQRAAEAIELAKSVRGAALQSVEALVRAVEAKDPYMRRHSEQVAHYAVNLARATALPEELVQTIHAAALMHDVGKIGVPDHILTKDGPLTEEEFGHIRVHPALGGDILAKITLLTQEAHLVRHHHERWDGQGYPDGLMGQETPLGARIVMIADCIDAMLMDRSYKNGYPPEKMIGELICCAGTQFDPQLAAMAVQWCRAHPLELVLPEQQLAATAS